MVTEPHTSQQHAGLHRAVWWPHQDATRSLGKKMVVTLNMLSYIFGPIRDSPSINGPMWMFFVDWGPIFSDPLSGKTSIIYLTPNEFFWHLSHLGQILGNCLKIAVTWALSLVWPDWMIFESSWRQNFFQKSPNDWQLFGQFWKTSLLWKNCCCYFLGNFGNIWATFYSNIWSHCLST